MTWTRALIGIITIGVVFYAVVWLAGWLTVCPEPVDGEVQRVVDGC